MKRVSKESRKSGKRQWCILLPLSLREGVCCGGKACMCYRMGHYTVVWDERGGSRRRCGESLKHRESRGTVRNLVC